MLYCHACNRPNRPSAEFCVGCGARLDRFYQDPSARAKLAAAEDAISGPFSSSRRPDDPNARAGHYPQPRDRRQSDRDRGSNKGLHETREHPIPGRPGMYETQEFKVGRPSDRDSEQRNPFSTQMIPRNLPPQQEEARALTSTSRPIAIQCKSCQKINRKKTPYCEHCGRPLTNLEGGVLLSYRWTASRTPNGDRALYVLCTVRPAYRFLSGTPVRNLGFLIDMSSIKPDPRSEPGARNKMVRQILEHVIEEMSANDFLTVGFFGRRPYLFLAAEKMEDKKAAMRLLQKKMETLDLGDGRYLAEGIEQVGREMRRNLTQEKVNRLIVVTDGECQDAKEALEACEIEREAGVSFSSLSLGEGEHSKFLAELARTGNGKCYPNMESKHIPEIFSQELMSARPTFTSQVEFFFHVEPGWNVSRVFKISPVIMDLGGKFADTRSFSVKLSDLQLHDDQALLLELTPTAVNRANQTVATAELVCDFPRDDVTNMNFVMPVQLLVPGDLWSYENEDVLKVVRMIMTVFGQKGLGFV